MASGELYVAYLEAGQGMKPETIACRAIRRSRDTAERTANLRDRLQAKIDQEGPDSIWAEMLAELPS